MRRGVLDRRQARRLSGGVESAAAPCTGIDDPERIESLRKDPAVPRRHQEAAMSDEATDDDQRTKPKREIPWYRVCPECRGAGRAMGTRRATQQHSIRAYG